MVRGINLRLAAVTTMLTALRAVLRPLNVQACI